MPPVLIKRTNPRDNHKAIRVGSGDGHIGLNSTSLAQPLGINEVARLHRNIAGTDPLQRLLGIRPGNLKFTKRGNIVDTHALPHRPVLFGVKFKPVLAFITVVVCGFGIAPCEPVGTLETGQFTKTGALLLELLVQWRLNKVAGSLVLIEGPMHRVGVPQSLRNTRLDIGLLALHRVMAAHIALPNIARRVAVDNPIRHQFSGAASGANALGVKAAGDKKVIHLGRRS